MHAPSGRVRKRRSRALIWVPFVAVPVAVVGLAGLAGAGPRVGPPPFSSVPADRRGAAGVGPRR